MDILDRLDGFNRFNGWKGWLDEYKAKRMKSIFLFFFPFLIQSKLMNDDSIFPFLGIVFVRFSDARLQFYWAI